VHYSSTIYCSHPYCSWKFQFFVYYLCKWFVEWLLTGEPMHSSLIVSSGAACPSYIRKWSIHYTSLSAMFDPLHSSTNQENCLKSTSTCNQIKVATMNNTDNFYCARKPCCTATKSTFFSVKKDEWTQRSTLLVHEEHIACTAVCWKVPFRLKQHWAVTKSSP